MLTADAVAESTTDCLAEERGAKFAAETSHIVSDSRLFTETR